MTEYKIRIDETMLPDDYQSIEPAITVEQLTELNPNMPPPKNEMSVEEIKQAIVDLINQSRQPKKLWCSVCEWYTEQEWNENADAFWCKEHHGLTD